MDEARRIRDFWFGPLPMSAQTLEERMRLWFGGKGASASQQERDATIRARFEPLIERAARGELDAWAGSPRRRLSLILLLDQFPRNIYRGTARAYAYDEQALALTLSGMQSGADAALDPVERLFFYMPLQHSESADVQEESVAAYRRLLHEAPAELRNAFEEALRFAELHRSIIERFGRYPHRNQALGRASTPEEEAYLQDETALRFGQ